MYKMRPHCRGNSLNNYYNSKSPDNQDPDNQGLTVLSLHDDKKN